MKTSKIRQSAKQEQCTVRIPGICNHNPATTVLAHVALKGLSGIGMKPSDIHACYACSSCHDVIDGRVQTQFTPLEILVWKLEAVFRTQLKLLEKDLIRI